MRRRTLAIVIALPTVAAGIALASGSSGYSFATFSSEATAAADQVWSALGHFHALREKLASILEHGYLKSPEMIIGVGTALTFPLVAIGSLAARFMMRWRRRRLRGEPAQNTVFDSRDLNRPGSRAWLEIPGGTDCEIGGELLRIGHDLDNDLTIADPGVQQFHALIRRTPESDFVVVDMTGATGSGIAVNGQRLRSWALRDGDRIEFGNAAVTFHRGPGRSTPQQNDTLIQGATH